MAEIQRREEEKREEKRRKEMAKLVCVCDALYRDAASTDNSVFYLLLELTFTGET